MIPNYPNFIKLGFEHRVLINDITSRYEPYSDFNFISLYSWNTDGSAEICLLNGNLVVKLPDYITNNPILSLIGEDRISESLDILTKQPHEIKLLPEFVIKNLESKHGSLAAIHDPDNDDYIYDLDKVSNLAGADFKKKRNKLNAFMQLYGDKLSFQETQYHSPDKIDRLKICFEEWAANREKESDDTDNERLAIERLLSQSQFLTLKCYEAWIGETMVGFSINELLPNSYSICHFQKALLNHINVEIYINVMVARALINEGCVLVNWEQDLGIAGLKQSKESYKPLKKLKKYRLNSLPNQKL